MKILIVDDEPIVRLSLKRALLKSGHEILEADDGQRGLEIWREARPQLVFLDVLMPRLSGPDVIKAARAADLTGGCKVILMSAFTGEYDLDRAKSLGADLFILKPFADIFEIVRRGEELVSGGKA